VECYNLQKGTKEGNPEYATRVNKCLDAWQKHFESVEDHTNKYLSNLRAKEVSELVLNSKAYFAQLGSSFLQIIPLQQCHQRKGYRSLQKRRKSPFC